MSIITIQPSSASGSPISPSSASSPITSSFIPDVEKCAECNKDSDLEGVVTCDKCGKPIHYSCSLLPPYELFKYTKKHVYKRKFTCKKCITTQYQTDISHISSTLTLHNKKEDEKEKTTKTAEQQLKKKDDELKEERGRTEKIVMEKNKIIEELVERNERTTAEIKELLEAEKRHKKERDELINAIRVLEEEMKNQDERISQLQNLTKRQKEELLQRQIRQEDEHQETDLRTNSDDDDDDDDDNEDKLNADYWWTLSPSDNTQQQLTKLTMGLKELDRRTDEQKRHIDLLEYRRKQEQDQHQQRQRQFQQQQLRQNHRNNYQYQMRRHQQETNYFQRQPRFYQQPQHLQRQRPYHHKPQSYPEQQQQYHRQYQQQDFQHRQHREWRGKQSYITCYFCGRRGHIARHCFQAQQQQRRLPTDNYTPQQTPTLHYRPQHYNPKQNHYTQYRHQTYNNNPYNNFQQRMSSIAPTHF